jgi:hypothetical protein
LSPDVPSEDTLMSVVVPATRSRRNTLRHPCVSSGTRFVAIEAKATYRPSREIVASQLVPLPCRPVLAMLTLDVVAALRSYTNWSSTPFVSWGTRLVAAEPYVTNLPLPEIEGSVLRRSASLPVDERLTRRRVPLARSQTKMSWARLRSPRTRFEAWEWKTMTPPSSEMAGSALTAFPCTAERATLTNLVTPCQRSLTKTSVSPLSSLPTRLEAIETNATNRPLQDTVGSVLRAFPCLPREDRLIRVVFPLIRSCRKTSSTPFVSPGTRLRASDWKATNRPFPEIAACVVAASPSSPVVERLTREIVCAWTSRRKTSSTPLPSPSTKSAQPPRYATWPIE